MGLSMENGLFPLFVIVNAMSFVSTPHFASDKKSGGAVSVVVQERREIASIAANTMSAFFMC